MENLFDWLKKHKIMSFVISVTIFVLPLIIINLLFKIDALNKFFIAEWSAGELLGYIGAFYALVGTIILGGLSLYQNKLFKDESDKSGQELNNAIEKLAKANDIIANAEEKFNQITMINYLPNLEINRSEHVFIHIQNVQIIEGVEGEKTTYIFLPLILSNLSFSNIIVKEFKITLISESIFVGNETIEVLDGYQNDTSTETTFKINNKLMPSSINNYYAFRIDERIDECLDEFIKYSYIKMEIDFLCYNDVIDEKKIKCDIFLVNCNPKLNKNSEDSCTEDSDSVISEEFRIIEA